MALDPNFVSTPRAGNVVVSTANTSRDGTGTIATLLTAGSAGTLIHSIRINALGATTAGMIRLFLNDGTNTRLFREIPIEAVTPSVTVPVVQRVLTFGAYDPLVLPTGWSLRASTNNAESFALIAIGGDL